MLITSESKRDLIHFVCLPKLRDSVLVNFKNGDLKIDNINFFCPLYKFDASMIQTQS